MDEALDIEDADSGPASPNIDYGQIEEEIEINDFINAMDLFSTEELMPSDPEKIDPFNFEPQTVSDFKTLELAFVRIINNTPQEHKIELVKQLLTSLTSDYRSLELKALAQKFAVRRV